MGALISCVMGALISRALGVVMTWRRVKEKVRASLAARPPPERIDCIDRREDTDSRRGISAEMSMYSMLSLPLLGGVPWRALVYRLRLGVGATVL